MAVKAALEDQDKAGIDIVSDGELRRDNDIDYLLPTDPPPLGLADEYRFTRRYTDRPVKFSFTGPFSLSHRIKNKAYSKSADLVRALAQVLNAEARALAEAGAELLLHVCYGNRYARLSWEGHDDFLFPAVLDANVDQLILEFGRKGYEDLHDPECGLRHLPADVARSKLAAMVEGTCCGSQHPADSGGTPAGSTL